MNDGLKKTPMNMLDKNERIKNFDEVELGYTKEEAIKEASRCLQCKNPFCMKGCPARISKFEASFDESLIFIIL